MPTQGVTWRWDSVAGGGAGSSPAGVVPGSAAGAGAPSGALWPRISDTTATAAPAPATANPIVDTVASDLPALRSDWPGSEVHTFVGHSLLTDDAFESVITPVIAPATRPTPPTTIPPYVSGPGVWTMSCAAS